MLWFAFIDKLVSQNFLANRHDNTLLHSATGRSSSLKYRSWVSATTPVIIRTLVSGGIKHRIWKTIPFIVGIFVSIESGHGRSGRKRSPCKSQKSADEAVGRNFVLEKSGEFFTYMTAHSTFLQFSKTILIQIDSILCSNTFGFCTWSV